VSFDRKKDFRSNLSEEQTSDNTPNDWKKQDRRSHNRAEGQYGRATGLRAMHGDASDRHYNIPGI